MDYLREREQYRLAYGKWLAMNRQLLALFDVSNDADLELAIAAHRGVHQDLIAQYGLLSIEFDRAGDKWDTAQLWQAQRTAAATKAMNQDLQLIEC